MKNEEEIDEDEWERPEWEEKIVKKTADMFLKFIHKSSMNGFPEPQAFKHAFDEAFTYAMEEILDRHNDEVDKRKKADPTYLITKFNRMQRHYEN